MNIQSFDFLIFVILFIFIILTVKPVKIKIIFLTIFNSIFLSSFINNIYSLSGFIFVLLFGFFLSKLILLYRNKNNYNIIFNIFIAVYILLFLIIKKYEFLNLILPTNILSHNIFLIGISYIFFKQIHVFRDIKNEIILDINFITYFNYLFGFYVLLAGPIQRYHNFKENLFYNKNSFNDIYILQSFNRIATGLIKLIILAIYIKKYTEFNWLFGVDTSSFYWFFKLIIFTYSFYLYLYFNFSGYCDLMIGISSLCGIKIPENFNKPFLARNMINFWERWHITLSEWLRDYLFTPICKFLFTTKLKNYKITIGIISYFTTFFLAGLWHGNTWNFVLLGFMFGTGVSFVKIYETILKKILSKNNFKIYKKNIIIKYIMIFVTINYVSISLILFNNNISEIYKIIKKIFNVLYLAQNMV